MRMKRMLGNQRGAALVFTMMTLMVLLILGVALLSVNAADNKESIHQDDNLQAYYLAKSGAMAMGKGIINQASLLSAGDFQTYLNSITDKTSDATYIGSSGGYFKVKVVNDASKGLGVVSTGTMRSVSKTVTVWLTKGSEPLSALIDCAAFADSSISMSGSAGITGDTYTNIDNPSSINPGGNAPTYFNGNLYVSGSDGSNWDAVKKHLSSGKTLKPNNPKYTFPMPEFPEIPELPNKGNFSTDTYQVFHIQANCYYPNITVSGSALLYIDTNNQDCSIVCDNLSVSGSNGIRINGTGTVKLYIKNSMSLSGSVGVSSNANNMLIYYAGGNLYLQGGATVIHGSFFAKNASISVGNSARITGVIMTGGSSVTISGAVNSQTIYAPNAAVSLENSASVSGSVISKTLSMSGAAKIAYSNVAESPFDTLVGTDTSASYDFGAWE